MIVKLLEVRDRATFIPVMAVSTSANDNDEQDYLLRRCGFLSGDCVILSRVSGGGISTADPYDWGDRTMQVAHVYIESKFEELKDGDVVDVEFILGESTFRKTSERLESA